MVVPLKQIRQDLCKIVKAYSEKFFPKIAEQLTPCWEDGAIVIPYLGCEDSQHILALKMMAMKGLKKKMTSQELVRSFLRQKRKDKIFLAYNLSHEFKIATLAASIALSNQEKRVFEVGPCCGFSSLHYSHLIKEKVVSKQISKLISIESNKEWADRANDIKNVVGSYIGEINFLFGDGINYLLKSSADSDIIFSSIAEPRVLEGLFAVSQSRTVNLVVSYSQKTNEYIKTKNNLDFENLLDSQKYDIFPFEDGDYNKHVNWDIRKIGVLALPISNS